MIPFFPKQISTRAIIVYLIALTAVSVMYLSYSMRIEYMIIGLVSVLAFFLLTSNWTQGWTHLSENSFLSRIFTVAVSIRIVWVFFSFFYYKNVTGIPFEYGAADSLGYHTVAEWLSEEPWNVSIEYFFGQGGQGVSDLGYPVYLTVLYKIFGSSIILTRLIKSFLSAYMCILIYRICSRTFDESTARMASIMAALMPNLIIYCGLHLKETEMIFLEVVFLERLDFLLRCRKVSFWNVLLPSIVAISLFFFRTVLGAAAVFSFATAVIFSSAPTMKKGWRRTALIGWGLLGLLVASGGTIMTEVESFWEQRDESVVKKRTEQTLRGNQWAQYATGAVMAREAGGDRPRRQGRDPLPPRPVRAQRRHPGRPYRPLPPARERHLAPGVRREGDERDAFRPEINPPLQREEVREDDSSHRLRRLDAPRGDVRHGLRPRADGAGGTVHHGDRTG